MGEGRGEEEGRVFGAIKRQNGTLGGARRRCCREGDAPPPRLAAPRTGRGGVGLPLPRGEDGEPGGDVTWSGHYEAQVAALRL